MSQNFKNFKNIELRLDTAERRGRQRGGRESGGEGRGMMLEDGAAGNVDPLLEQLISSLSKV
jgi:hypothetical protein